MQYTLEKLKKHRLFVDNIKWITPTDIFEPKFSKVQSHQERIKRTQSFMFYIDYLEDRVNLMIMKTYRLTSKTIGEVTGVPKEMLLHAVRHKSVKEYCFMFPIDEELTDYLKEKLGIAP